MSELPLYVQEADRKVDIRLHGKGNSKLHWRKAGQPRHLVDVVDSDQWVFNEELSLYTVQIVRPGFSHLGSRE